MADIIDTIATAIEKIEPKTDSIAEIKAMREDTDPRLQQVADIVSETKLHQAKIENDKALIGRATFWTLALPLKAFGYAGRKINEILNNLSESQRQSLNQKIQRVAEKNIEITSLPTLATATEAYLYTEQEPDLAELFENLIANCVDRSQKVHPSYVEVLKQLSGKEAYLLKSLFRRQKNIELPICNIILYDNDVDSGFKYAYRNLVDLVQVNYETGEKSIFTSPELPSMIDNFIRLSLFHSKYDRVLVDTDYASIFENRPEYLNLKQILKPGEKLDLEQGILLSTNFGESFFKAVSQNQS